MSQLKLDYLYFNKNHFHNASNSEAKTLIKSGLHMIQNNNQTIKMSFYRGWV